MTTIEPEKPKTAKPKSKRSPVADYAKPAKPPHEDKLKALEARVTKLEQVVGTGLGHDVNAPADPPLTVSLTEKEAAKLPVQTPQVPQNINIIEDPADASPDSHVRALIAAEEAANVPLTGATTPTA